MNIPDTLDLTTLPKPARRQVYDFYLAAKQHRQPAIPECALLSEEVLARDWLTEEEDEAWRDFQ